LRDLLGKRAERTPQISDLNQRDACNDISLSELARSLDDVIREFRHRPPAPPLEQLVDLRHGNFAPGGEILLRAEFIVQVVNLGKD
jgi:hypothetical protein